ncbi:WD40 repeat-like protein [Polyporus arcularius HHB13444]|uniref:WD40 repeat-like protein n=1 Tax=Polyporus arcularius HHB13444 TaxID=1314778 RepID=A0A5C3P152_9APHY|nr:WD40 repeat-like protein [Polyporus arcularius HHB13444]
MRTLSKLVLSEIRFVNLASFCRFILAFPSLKMLDCHHVDAATHEFQHIVQAFTTQTLEIRALNVSATVGSYLNMRIILALVRDIRPGSLAHLKVVFEGSVRIPALRDGKAGASEDLQRLDDVLSSFPGMAGVTFVIPRETKQRYTFWSTAFQDCFVRLRERGCLIDIPTYEPTISEPAPSDHAGSVTCLTVSPDSRWLASGSEDTTIILREIKALHYEDYTAFRKWEANVDIVRHLTFSPDSQRLVCCGSNGRIVVWDLDQCDELGVLEGHTKAVGMVAWSPDGITFASCSDDTTVRIWEAETYQEVFRLEGHRGPVLSVAFSSDGELLASCGADWSCRIWEVETGLLKSELSGHRDRVLTAVFDPAASRIATASDDGTVRIWSVETGAELVLLNERHGPVVAFNEHGKQIMSVSSDSTVQICSSLGGDPILALGGHSALVNDAKLSSDGEYIASASADHTMRLWNRSDGANIATFDDHGDKVLHVVFSPDGQTVSSASEDGKVCTFDLSYFA